MSPYGQRPLDLGADCVVHSSTKYIGGHSDVLGGAIVTRDDELASQLYFIQKSGGAVPSPFDCWLLLRSTKTLALRVKKASENALLLAQMLDDHPSVLHTIYPGLQNHPQHQLAKRQQKEALGRVSGQFGAGRGVKNFKESSKYELSKASVSPSLIRLYISP